MKKLFKYEFLYLYKTQKFLVFFGLFILFSIISPLTAKYLKEILHFLLAGQNMGIPVPEPTVYTAYEQYISDLYQTIFYVVLFVSVSIFTKDKRKGLLALIFSKPINRKKYVLSEYSSFVLLLFVSIVLGYLVFSYYTYFLFNDIFFVKGIEMMALYFVFLAFISSVALYFSTVSKNYLLTLLPTFGIYILFAVLTIAGESTLFKYLPGMLPQSISQILYGVASTKDILLNVFVTIVLTILFLVGSVNKIRKIEIS
jgi:ABC-2 type transport system permease protein